MIREYTDLYEEVWDRLVLENSINGNFLQTRKFLNYHPKNRFKDASIMFFKDDKLAAVIPANEIENGKKLIAHQGSTFGGIVIAKEFANTNGYKWIFGEMMNYFKEKNYDAVELRMHSWLYSSDVKHHELLDYFFQLNGFYVRSEVGFFIELDLLEKDFTVHFEKLKRRKLNKAKKYGLVFKKLENDLEILEFYKVLSDNMLKFNTVPVHTYQELIEFKHARLKQEVSFYGVYFGESMIAGSMVFNFCNKKVFHTQYLASKQDCLDYCPNEFLYASLIEEARNEGYKYLSYGTTTLDHGNIYNESLGMYKEGFDTDSYLNRCYIWNKCSH